MMKNVFFFLTLLCAAMLANAEYTKFFGCIWKTSWVSPNDCGNLFKDLFDQVTPENAGKWGSAEPQRGYYKWATLDAMFNSANVNGFQTKQHTFVWGQQEPGWIKNYINSDTVKAIVENWIQEFMKRYAGKVDMIDVVNEPLPAAPSYKSLLGGSGQTGWDWVIWCFEKARKHAPGSKLLINDYNILKNESKATKFLQIIQILKNRGLLDGVGLQAHFLESTNRNTIRKLLDMMATANLPIYISELDLNIANDQAQLQAYQEIFPILWEHPRVKHRFSQHVKSS